MAKKKTQKRPPRGSVPSAKTPAAMKARTQINFRPSERAEELASRIADYLEKHDLDGRPSAANIWYEAGKEGLQRWAERLGLLDKET